MSVLDIFAIIISLSAVFAFLNYKFLKLPTTIALMAMSLVISLIIIGLGQIGVISSQAVETLILRLDFNATLMEGMLSFLLFAGSLHVNLSDLSKYKGIIGTLASFGVIASTFIIGICSYGIFQLFELEVPFIMCLLFGSLISPTDPVAVLGILKKAKAPKSIESIIAGESLFNDGIGVVIFIIILGLATGGADLTFASGLSLFATEALGGGLLGLAIGYGSFQMIKRVDQYQVEILITLAAAFGGYALADSLHTSGPIAVVVTGLFMGNTGRRFGMSEKTIQHVDTFWELIDEILNAVLFVILGLEILIISFDAAYLTAGLIAIPMVLAVRFICIGVPITIVPKWNKIAPHAIRIMTWGGLRGGISIALALQIPSGTSRDVILTVTYCVVTFSILVQGLTIGKLVKSSQ